MPSAIIIDDSPIMRAQLRKLLGAAEFSDGRLPEFFQERPVIRLHRQVREFFGVGIQVVQLFRFIGDEIPNVLVPALPDRDVPRNLVVFGMTIVSKDLSDVRAIVVSRVFVEHGMRPLGPIGIAQQR